MLRHLYQHVDRRNFLKWAGAVAAGIPSLSACKRQKDEPEPSPPDSPAFSFQDESSVERPVETSVDHPAENAPWDGIRSRFLLDPDYVHLACMLIASHPDTVREKIAKERDALDRNPGLYLESRKSQEEERSRKAAAEYLGVEAREVALTGNTTSGLAELYSGIQAKPGQEFVTTSLDYYATKEALRLRTERTGVVYKEIDFEPKRSDWSEDEIVAKISKALSDKSRVLALTWVHSSTGLKFPIRSIASVVAAHNADREPEDRLVLCVDGVHGLGVEDFTIDDLGCDFFVAGCHKWLFGPRGTGILWGKRNWWPLVTPVSPTFSGQSTHGRLHTPGGFHAFDHRWGVPEAFAFHREVGKAKIAGRIRELNDHFKEELQKIKNLRLITPMDSQISSGIICFEMRGLTPNQIVGELKRDRIVASVTPYETEFARFSTGILNSHQDIERTLAALKRMAA